MSELGTSQSIQNAGQRWQNSSGVSHQDLQSHLIVEAFCQKSTICHLKVLHIQKKTSSSLRGEMTVSTLFTTHKIDTLYTHTLTHIHAHLSHCPPIYHCLVHNIESNKKPSGSIAQSTRLFLRCRSHSSASLFYANSIKIEHASYRCQRSKLNFKGHK